MLICVTTKLLFPYQVIVAADYDRLSESFMYYPSLVTTVTHQPRCL